MRTRARVTLAGLALGAALAGGVAWATIPADNVYTACKLRATGTIRLIDPSGPSNSLLSRCTSYETQITWNQQGPKGAQGLQGIPGPQGGKGDTGAQGAAGMNGVDGKDGQAGTNGTNGVDGAPGAPGDPCLPANPACVGPTGPPGVDGEAGPAGGLSGRVIVSDSTTVGFGEYLVDVSCPAGTLVTGGGATANAFSAGSIAISRSFPHETSFQSGWRAYGANTTTAQVTFTVYAICAAAA